MFSITLLLLSLTAVLSTNDACGSVNKNRCVEAIFRDLSLGNTRPTSTAQLQQFDDPQAVLGTPGRWTKFDRFFLRENSNIRPAERAPNCPPRRSFGTSLILNRARTVLDVSRTEYLFRTTVSTGDLNGWFGVVFAYKSATEHFRFSVRANGPAGGSCASVQKRKGTSADPWNTINGGTAPVLRPILTNVVYTIDVRWTDKTVKVTMRERGTDNIVVTINASDDGGDLRLNRRADVGLFSSANSANGGVTFRNWVLSDSGADLPTFVPRVDTATVGSYFE